MEDKKDVVDPAADNIDKFDIETSDDNAYVSVSGQVTTDEDIIPEMYDRGWSEYVLRQFEDDEIDQGNPKVEGLRRVATKVLGPIIRSVPVRENPPSYHNNNHAMVVWEIDIKFPDGTIRTFGDVADVSSDNTDREFAIYPSATAATRAEGRALRKALQLKQVIAAEESADTKVVTSSKINSGQISFIDMVSQRNDINVLKLINMSKKEKFEKIEDVPYGTAVLMQKYLSECQRGVRPIPESIKGYEPNWRN